LRSKSRLPQINDRILADKLQVISEKGENFGVITKDDALLKSQAAGLDLVVISDSGPDGVPVAKIMDFGKGLYSKKKKFSEGKKKQKAVKVKEIKVRPKISDHDFLTKLNQGIKFLTEGKRLKVTVMFRGRENANKKELGPQMFDKVSQTLNASDKIPSKNLVSEKTVGTGQFWSRVYYIK